MKYGETLQQRSIPEWGPYNVDYNDLKRLIKLRTTQDQPQAIDVSGNGTTDESSLQAFEDELYAELLEQYQRIDLFVKSKAGEIQRRLDHLYKQILRLGQRSFPTGPKRISVRKLEKFSKAEEDVLRAGEEIQSLSRFIGVQRMAFHKILKKYTKWTHSSSLLKRFFKVLDQPTSFSRRDLQPLLLQWTNVLAAVREPFGDGTAFEPGARDSVGTPNHPGAQKQSRYMSPLRETPGPGLEEDQKSELRSHWPAQQLCHTSDTGSALDLDVAIATLPFGSNGGQAVYWVHYDNLVELQVLLLQYTRLRVGAKKSSNDSSPETVSPVSSRPASSNGGDGLLAGESGDEAGLAVVDDLNHFARTSNTSKSASTDPSTSSSGSVRWCSGRDAVIVLGNADKPQASKRIRSVVKAVRLKRKHVRSLFDFTNPARDPPQPSFDLELATSPIDANALDQIRDWISSQEDFRPLVQVWSKRTRLLGLLNDWNRGVWALLDRDIKMTKPSIDDLGRSEKFCASIRSNVERNKLEPSSEEPVSFPHAVLVIRWEGEQVTDLSRVLDRSHLTERVPDFSMESHAVAVLYQPPNMTPPSWLPALDSDIRKVPVSSRLPRQPGLARGKASSANYNSSSTASTSDTMGRSSTVGTAAVLGSSASSVPDLGEIPSLRVDKKPRKNRSGLPFNDRVSDVPEQGQTRYWNEYDDGDEADEEGPYTIFIDPDEYTAFPGQRFLSGMASRLAKSTKSTLDRSTGWFSKAEEDEEAEERRPLFSDYFNHQPPMSETDIENASSSDNVIHERRRYGTLPIDPRIRSAIYRENFLYGSYLGCALAAVVLMVVATILDTTGRQSLRFPVHLGVVVGVVGSLCCAVVAISMMLLKRQPLGWTHCITALSMFGVICLWNGVVLAHVGADT